MVERSPSIRVDTDPQHDVPVLVVDGVLDSSTYRGLRDTVIKAALDEPRAVIVDVDRLRVPTDSAWTVFTSARWHVSTWPDVPILLVCPEPSVRRAIIGAGVARYVPVHPSRERAMEAVRSRSLQGRRRARTELPRSDGTLGMAGAVVTDWLTEWRQSEAIPIATTVATVFIENVLDHTDSAPVLVVESYRETVTVAVEDGSDQLPVRHEDARRGAEIVSGLAIVAALCRAWGATPTSSGKTVWAMVGREDRI
ncbi:sulfate transporter [Mycobacterium scrofulaceum]|uniref:STAS domain-containing protein n=1 Tax=Mycobacterium scrofulaceum TaxID=1783 RepID=UPI00080189A8|nr:STAS domain-containing protein [Mycobacterium scrofulaceum]OBH84548.1 sulfate transporter [Mycobacterium scrofulaceum]